jgi:hypothetical protein
MAILICEDLIHNELDEFSHCQCFCINDDQSKVVEDLWIDLLVLGPQKHLFLVVMAYTIDEICPLSIIVDVARFSIQIFDIALT